MGLGTASDFAMREMEKNRIHTKKLRDYLDSELLKMPGTKVNGNTKFRLPNTTNIFFEGIDSDALMMGM